jgi:hypothetical protein
VLHVGTLSRKAGRVKASRLRRKTGLIEQLDG